MGGEVIAEGIAGGGFAKGGDRGGLLFRRLAAKRQLQLDGGILRVILGGLAGEAEVIQKPRSHEKIHGRATLILEERFDLELIEFRHLTLEQLLDRDAGPLGRPFQLRNDVGG